MYYKEVISMLAILLTFAAFIPYMKRLAQHQIQPHYFSWIIWGLATFIVFLAQLQDNGGLGAWPIGISGLLTILIAVMAYRRREGVAVTRMDWGFLILALSSLPVWVLTSDPLWAVVVLTTVEVLGFGPSVRKAYAYPFEEDVTFFVLFFIRNILSVVALEHYSMTTILFPLTASAACMILILTILWRRKAMS